MTRLKPIRYRIHLEPDLETFRFSGTTEILAEATAPVREVSLNVLDLDIGRCGLIRDGHAAACPFRVIPEREALCIALPDEISGSILLRIDYRGRINDGMAGFYRSRYRTASGEQYMAVTQFEESDARRAFPCFDHPAVKAVFDVELVIDKELTAVGNQPVAETAPCGPGKKRVRFERTPRMSTYLLFFGVGRFETLENPSDARVRAVAPPGLIAHAAMGLGFGATSLAFCEKAFGTPYPLPKLDLIVVPDFAFGAMENWGAMTFRENLMLHFPGITSRADTERMFEVIAHEIVHQWFGNLVTPADWKYLWLNESFATYFGYGAVAAAHPEWDMWEKFLYAQTETALDRDALRETPAIEIPGGEHVVINTATAPVIYNKGAAVLRHVREFMGGPAFQAGLRHYLEKNAYGCAASPDMWAALEAVSDRPVTRIMKSWVEQPGFPLVTAERDGRRLILTQERFTYLPGDSNQTWSVPVSVRVFHDNGESRVFSSLLEDRRSEIDMGPGMAAYKVNDRQAGFYRVRYMADADLEALGPRAASGDLPAEDRWGLQSDLYALVMAGAASLERYLAFLTHYTDETAFLPMAGIAGNLFHAYLVTDGPLRTRLAEAGKGLLERVLDRIGFEPAEDERHTRSALRDRILFDAAFYGSTKARDFALERFSALTAGRPVSPEIMKSILAAGALDGNGAVLEWFKARLASTGSEHERLNILAALGKFRDREMIREVLEYILDTVPARNRFIAIGAMARNPHAVPLLWDWYCSRIHDLEALHPLHYERVIVSVVPLAALGREEEATAFLEEYAAKKTSFRDAVALALEKLAVNARMRNR